MLRLCCYIFRPENHHHVLLHVAILSCIDSSHDASTTKACFAAIIHVSSDVGISQVRIKNFKIRG
jgi:hypothetical protein